MPAVCLLGIIEMLQVVAKKKQQFLLRRLCRTWELHAKVGFPEFGLPRCPMCPILYHIFWKEVSVAPSEDIQLWVVQCRILVHSPVLLSQRAVPLEKIQGWVGWKEASSGFHGLFTGEGEEE